MSDNTAKLKVSIDNISSLSKPVQSFANFIMSDCSLYSIRKLNSSLLFDDIPENKQPSAELLIPDEDDNSYSLKEPYSNYNGKFKINKVIIPLEDTDGIIDANIDISISDDSTDNSFIVIDGVYKDEHDIIASILDRHQDEIESAIAELGVDIENLKPELGVVLTHKLRDRVASNIQANYIHSDRNEVSVIAAKYGEINYNDWDPGECAKFIAPDDFEITNIKEIKACNEGPAYSGTIKFTLSGNDATITISNGTAEYTATIEHYLNASKNDLDSITVYDQEDTEFRLDSLINIIEKSNTTGRDNLGFPDHTSDSSPYEIEISLTNTKTENDVLAYLDAPRVITNCDTDYVKHKSEFNLFTLSTNDIDVLPSSDTDALAYAHSNLINIPKFSVTISTIVNEKENKDRDLIPVFTDDPNTDSINESIYSSVKINSNSHKNIIWKLRTSSFYLIPPYGSNEITRNVYYKIGFCPLDGTEISENKIINYLKLHCLQINNSSISLKNILSVDKPLSLKLIQTDLDQYPSSLWSIILDDEENNLGIIYMKLYDSITGNVLDKSQYIVNNISDSESDSSNYIYLQIVDFNIDKGYMVSTGLQNEINLLDRV